MFLVRNWKTLLVLCVILATCALIIFEWQASEIRLPSENITIPSNFTLASLSSLVKSRSQTLASNTDTCVASKRSDVTQVQWSNASDCEHWTFTNRRDVIFSRDQAEQILSNTTMIMVGISNERRVIHTISEWLFDHDDVNFSKYHNRTKHPNGLIAYSDHYPNMYETAEKLRSTWFRNLVRSELEHNQTVLLFVALPITTLDSWIQVFYNYTYNAQTSDTQDYIDCNQAFSYKPSKLRLNEAAKKQFDACWSLNVQRNGLKLNPEVLNAHKQILSALNEHYNIEHPNFYIIIRSSLVKTLVGGRGGHPYTDNKEGYYFVKTRLYQLLCESLTLDSNRWRIINMYELSMNKSNHNRYDCLPPADGGFHFTLLGRYVYAHKILNLLQSMKIQSNAVV